MARQSTKTNKPVSVSKYRTATRQREIFTTAASLLNNLDKTPKDDETYLAFAIDNAFFFRFHPDWVEEIEQIRNTLFGAIAPLANAAAASAWVADSEQDAQRERRVIERKLGQALAAQNKTANNQKLQLSPEKLYEQLKSYLPTEVAITPREKITASSPDVRLLAQESISLARKFGLPDPMAVSAHILYGKPVNWPYASGGSVVDDYGVPCFVIRIYSVHALRRFEKLHPVLFSIFSAKQREAIRRRLRDSGGGRLVGSGASTSRLRRRYKSMDWKIRIRTWVILLLSKSGGGSLTQSQAVVEWNEKIHSWADELPHGSAKACRLLELEVSSESYSNQKRVLVNDINHHLPDKSAGS